MKTTKINKVLIALDYDPTAQKVAEQGFSLAKNVGAEIFLLHVVSDPIHYSAKKQFTVMGFAGYKTPASHNMKDPDELRQESQVFLEKSKHHLDDQEIKTLVKAGNISDSILMCAEEVNADIIVLGSYNRKTIDNIDTGSITGKVMESALIPLFIIPVEKI